LYRAADAIVPNSFSQTNFIKKNYPGLGNKTYTITNFVDTELFVPALSDGIGVDDNLTKIICVGRVCVQKNVLRFISAIKKVVESGIRIKVDWYGYKGIDLTYFNQCETLVRKEDLGDVFEFHDAITNIADMYPQYNVFCLPSIYEGYPNVVCEAMSCGLPILCSDVCDNGRIVRGDVNGYLFDPLSVDSIANTIIKFAKLPSEKKKNMQIKSREFSVSDFSYNTFVDKYLKLIAKC
jgi:glycosyltransferase involved in cell wall biosynthesis